MEMSNRILFPLVARLFRAAVVLLSILSVIPRDAAAQKTATAEKSSETIIPAPPIQYESSFPARDPTPTTHQAKQDPNDPTHAYDSTTGQNLTWDPDKKTWVDSKTGKSVGFNGLRTSDGTIIPAPPIQYESSFPSRDPPPTTHQAKQDPDAPTHAYDSTTGQNLYWDPDKKTWVDSKTGQSVGFDGVRVP